MAIQAHLKIGEVVEHLAPNRELTKPNKIVSMDFGPMFLREKIVATHGMSKKFVLPLSSQTQRQLYNVSGPIKYRKEQQRQERDRGNLKNYLFI